MGRPSRASSEVRATRAGNWGRVPTSQDSRARWVRAPAANQAPSHSSPPLAPPVWARHLVEGRGTRIQRLTPAPCRSQRKRNTLHAKGLPRARREMSLSAEDPRPQLPVDTRSPCRVTFSPSSNLQPPHTIKGRRGIRMHRLLRRTIGVHHLQLR